MADDFKCLTQRFGSEKLALLKQKGTYQYQWMDSLKRFREEKLHKTEGFYNSVKDGKNWW